MFGVPRRKKPERASGAIPVGVPLFPDGLADIHRKPEAPPDGLQGAGAAAGRALDFGPD